MKKMFRTTISFTEKQYKETPPSNLFIRAQSLDEANGFAIAVFKATLKENNLVGAEFKAETVESSDAEATAYQKGLNSNLN